MKQKLLNKLWLRVGMIVAIMTTALSGTAWGQSDYSAVETSNCTLTAGTNGSTCTVNNKSGIKVGTSSKGGNMTVTVPSGAKYLHVHAAAWKGVTGLSLNITPNTNISSTSISLTADDGISSNSPFTLSGNAEDFYFVITFTNALTDQTTFTFTSSIAKRFVVWGVNSEEESSYNITAQSNNSNYGTVSLSGTTITATPASGYRVSTSTPYSVSPANSATVSQNGNEFTVTPSANTTVTINFEAMPTVPGYVIDFEHDLEEYIDWQITNLTKTDESLTAHGGSYFAKTNGTQTAAVQTKVKVAYPDVFTCYISKIGTNTNAGSQWKIQVSSDGSTWTDIATHAAAVGVTADTWYEVTGDIKAAGYANVYVRLYYDGSTAVRTVDDISLTTYTPAAVEEPVISVTSPFTISTTATITCVTEGAIIYYSFNGDTWTEYTEALTLTSTTTIYAKAVKGNDESTVAQVTATKELVTPTVEISATSFNIGETATVTTNGPAVTLTTSDATVASVSGTTVTGVAAGTATITATWSATADYSAGSEEFVVTVVDPNAPGSVNNPYTVAQALAVIDGLANGAKTDNEVYVAGTVTQIDEVSTQYHNATYWISNDGGTTKLEVYHGKYLNNANFTSSEQIKVNDQVVVYGKLQKYVKNSVVTPEIAADNYIYSLVREKLDPTINVSDASIAYGSTFTVSGIEGGDITVTSDNVAVARVDGLVITPVAVGTVTITVATAENASYKAGSETFELTVTAPVGGTTAPTGSAGGTIFEETFAGCTEEAGGNDGNFATASNTEISTADDFTDNDDWSLTKGYPAKGCLKFGGSKASGGAITPSITATIGTTYTLSFKAAPWNTESTTMNVSVDGGTISGLSEDAMSTGEWNDFTASITATATSFTVTFGASNNRFFLDDVKVEAPASPAPAITATLNGSGYATFCSKYPLDFSGVTDFSAWQITDIDSDNKITFEQVTGKVKGGTGLFLKGTAEATVTIPSANSENTLSGNKLNGTLAPTYFAAGEIYGLAGDTFKKNNAGSIKANKAYIDASEITVSGGSGAKAFTFVFEDEATGIKTIETVSAEEAAQIFNLAGQRINKMQKGINIVNGKKILK